MGNVNEILRRKSLLKDGISSPADYGEPIFHPSMWKVVFKCLVTNSSFNPDLNFITLFQKAKYDTIILDDIVVMENGILKEEYRNVIKFFRNGVEVNNNDAYTYSGDRYYQQRMVFNLGDFNTHTLYFTLQKQNDHWHAGGYSVWHTAPNPLRGMVISIRTPTDEFLNDDDTRYDIFGPYMNNLGGGATLESLTHTPLNTTDGITKIFNKVRVPINTTAAYISKGYSRPPIVIEEFKFTPIPDN